MVDYFEGSGRGRWRNIGLAALFLVLGLFLMFLPQDYQTPIRQAIRGTVLQPFIWAQSELVTRSVQAVDLNTLRAERDSLAAVVSAQALPATRQERRSRRRPT